MTSHRRKEEASEGAEEAAGIRGRQRQGVQAEAERRRCQAEGNAEEGCREGTT